ncbi:hypothetical protein CC2G_000113 [Coprinopsis cinerea AmutBmut pab1-1]|nr:hypothetical protein CC2G_000113 [Coprinopsis cinerea AmutBmut pab1-1]
MAIGIPCAHGPPCFVIDRSILTKGPRYHTPSRSGRDVYSWAWSPLIDGSSSPRVFHYLPSVNIGSLPAPKRLQRSNICYKCRSV